jgi:phosphate uptake regulator
MRRFYRKLQKISETLFISLPKSWITKFQLSKSSTVAIDIRSDGCLVINPKLKETESYEFEEILLEATKSIPRDIVKHSIMGIDKIVIVSDKKIESKILEDIHFFVDRLPNTSIFEESPQRIEIRTFKIENIPTYQIIKKLLYLTEDMFEDVRDNNNKRLLKNFSEMRGFYYTLVRYIRKYLRTGIFLSEDKDLTPLEAMDLRMFCQKIERIGEVLINLQINEKVLEFFNIIETYYKEVMDAYLKKNYESAYILWNKRDLILKQFKEIYNEYDQNDVDKLKDLEMIAHACKDMTALI